MSTTANHRARIVALAALASVVVALLAWLLWPASPESSAPMVAGAGADGAVDAAPSPPALDLAPEGRPPSAEKRPRPMTHRVSDAELRRKLRGHGGLIRACYHRAVRKGVHQVPRRARVEIELAAGGRVKRAKVMGSLGPQLRACLRRSLLGWRFARNARAQTLRFPIVLAR